MAVNETTPLWLQASCHILTAKPTFQNRLAASTLPGGTVHWPELNPVPSLNVAWEGAEPKLPLGSHWQCDSANMC